MNPLNANLCLICHLLALLGTHHILHVSRVRVNAFPLFCESTATLTCTFVGYLFNFVFDTSTKSNKKFSFGRYVIIGVSFY